MTSTTSLALPSTVVSNGLRLEDSARPTYNPDFSQEFMAEYCRTGTFPSIEIDSFKAENLYAPHDGEPSQASGPLDVYSPECNVLDDGELSLFDGTGMPFIPPTIHDLLLSSNITSFVFEDGDLVIDQLGELPDLDTLARTINPILLAEESVDEDIDLEYISSDDTMYDGESDSDYSFTDISDGYLSDDFEGDAGIEDMQEDVPVDTLLTLIDIPSLVPVDTPSSSIDGPCLTADQDTILSMIPSDDPTSVVDLQTTPCGRTTLVQHQDGIDAILPPDVLVTETPVQYQTTGSVGACEISMSSDSPETINDDETDIPPNEENQTDNATPHEVNVDRQRATEPSPDTEPSNDSFSDMPDLELMEACLPLFPIDDFVVSEAMWVDAKKRLKRSFHEIEVEEEYAFNKRMKEMRSISTNVPQVKGFTSAATPIPSFNDNDILDDVVPDSIPRETYRSINIDMRPSVKVHYGPLR